MTRGTPARILVSGLLLVACGGTGEGPDGGPPDGSAPDDAAVVDAGSDAALDAGADAGPPADTLTVTRWGERLYGPVLAMSRIDRELWIGTGAVTDPSLGDTAPVRSQLVRLDLDSGALRVFEAELPRSPHESGVDGPTPTAGVVADGARRWVAARAGLLAIDGDAVSLHALVVEGAPASPPHLALARADGRARLWASTDLGLLEIDPDTAAIRASVSLETLGGMPGPVAVDPGSGAVYAAVLAAGGGSHVVRRLGDSQTQLTPGDSGNPGGAVGDVAWSRAHGAALIALASWDPRDGGVITWDGATVSTLVDEDALSRAARGESVPFGATTLAYDESAGVLVVGGRIHRTGPIGILEGGGLAWVDVSDPSAARGLFGVSTTTSDIRGDVVSAAAYDPVGQRTYVALRQPCNELKIGNVGIHAIAFERGEPRFEMPILSSVRDLQRVDGELFVGVRDDNPGIACDGVEVQTGFARVDAHRAALVPSVRGWTPGRFGVTEIDLSGSTDPAIAAAGFRTELFAGSLGGGVLLSPAIDIGTSLWPEDVLWENERTLWVAGRTSHGPGDPPLLANTGPRGAARIVLDESGAVGSITRYVRQERDTMRNVIEGLPSAEVYDVVMDAAGAVYLVCGEERLMGTYDREIREEFRLDGELRRGGVVRIEDDGSITTLAGPTVVPDGRAGAFAPDGTLYVLDADRGLLRRTAADFEAVELADVPAGAVPQTLWIGSGDDLVAGYDLGALVRLGGQSLFIGDVGVVWNVDASGEVLLLGTDRGLVRVIPEGVSDASEPAPIASELPPFVTLSPPPPPPVLPDGGVCLGEGEVCAGDPTGCCPGLVCSSFGFVQSCAAP